MLNELGRREVGAGPSRRPTPHPERVLHVATQAHGSGGHVRVLERWIEHDARRTATLVLLGQDGPLPASLRAACATAGTAVVTLPTADLLQRARDLRTLAGRHDLVVLHVAPWDVLAALAFADGNDRPPTVRYNHASRLLWVGAGATDVLASGYATEAADAVARRGFPAERSLVLPPPARHGPLPSRGTARAALNLPATAPVLLTVATPAQLSPALTPGFEDVALRLLEALPDAYLLVAGPGPDSALVPRHPRVRALDPEADVGALLAAADLLVDSWPAGDPSTRLDAGAAGLPCLVLGGARALDELVRRASALLDGDTRRRTLSARMRSPAAGPEPSGWPQALQQVVDAAVAQAGAAAAPRDGSAAATDAEAVQQLLSSEQYGDFSPYHAYAWCAADLPAEDRPQSVEDLGSRVDALLDSDSAPESRRAESAPR